MPGGPAGLETRKIFSGSFDEGLNTDVPWATTAGQEGLELLAKVQQLEATLPVVVMTVWASVEGAVEAMGRGAEDSPSASCFTLQTSSFLLADKEGRYPTASVLGESVYIESVANKKQKPRHACS